MVKGEDHYRDCQPQGHPQAITGGGRAAQGEGFQRCAVPLRDQVAGQHHQGDNEREHQHAHRFYNHLLTEAHDSHHADNQDQRQNGARWRRHAQLVGHKAVNGVGDSHAIHQQDWVDGKEVEQGNQLTCANPEVLFNHFSDVFARIFAGEHKTGQAAVCEVGHRERNDCHDDQRN